MMFHETLYDLPCDRTQRDHLINRLLQKNAFISREVIGESRCSRPVEMLCIGNRSKQVLLAGAFHGMEYLTSALLLRLLEELADAIRSNSSIYGIRPAAVLNLRGLAVIPCVNPDGVEICLHGTAAAGPYTSLVEKAGNGNTSRWQANAAGVDINHNFDAGWEELHLMEQQAGIHAPAPTRYGGEYPESEPESRIIASYCRAGNVTRAFAFHSQGEEIYWSFGNYTAQEAYDIGKKLSFASGYTLCEPEGLAVGGGFKDWFEEKLERPAFTIEIGKGQNPLPPEDLEPIYQKTRKMLILSLIL